VPSLSETAHTPQLLIARWVVFLSLFAALGLFVLRALIARPVARRVSGTSLRPLSSRSSSRSGSLLVAVPVFVVLATAQFSLARRSTSARSSRGERLVVRARLPAARARARALRRRGRDRARVDRPERPARSVAELLATGARSAAAAATLVMPGLAGHAGQRSPRGLALPLDAVHLAAGAIWLGG
jgi:copper transport protein